MPNRFRSLVLDDVAQDTVEGDLVGVDESGLSLGEAVAAGDGAKLVQVALADDVVDVGLGDVAAADADVLDAQLSNREVVDVGELAELDRDVGELLRADVSAGDGDEVDHGRSGVLGGGGRDGGDHGHGGGDEADELHDDG